MTSHDQSQHSVKLNRDLNRDRVLMALAAIPERTNMELGITLNVSGLIIAGYLISEENYFFQLMDVVGNARANQDVKDNLEEFIDQLRQELKHEEETDLNLPSFIHLRDVRMYPSQGQGMPTQGKALWRGHLSSVDGFSLGEMVSMNFDGASMAPQASQ